MITLTANNAALKTLQNALEQLDPKNQRFAVAVALTRTAKIAQEDLKTKMASAFDRPNPYTLNATFAQTASKTNLQSAVKIKDKVSKGKASGKNQPNRYLNPEIYSGFREQKGIEKKLASIDPALAGKLIVPTKNVQLDSYGNPSRGIYNKVVAGLIGKGKTAKGRTSKTLFVVQRNGIYQIERDVKSSGRGNTRKVRVTNTDVKRMFNIVDKARYRTRLDFYGIVKGSYEANFQKQLIEAIKFARETAR